MANAMHVQGVGNGSQKCEWEATLPIALPRSDGSHSIEAYTAPVVPGSQVPGLLGLRSMIKKRAVIDTIGMKLYLAGPGGISITASPGTEIFELEQAPSGHLLLPISNFRAALASREAGRDRLVSPPMHIHLPVTEASSSTGASSSTDPVAAPANPTTANSSEPAGPLHFHN